MMIILIYTVLILCSIKFLYCFTQYKNYVALSDTAINSSAFEGYLIAKYSLNSRMACMSLCSKNSNCKSALLYDKKESDNCYLYNETATFSQIYSKGSSLFVQRTPLQVVSSNSSNTAYSGKPCQFTSDCDLDLNLTCITNTCQSLNLYKATLDVSNINNTTVSLEAPMRVYMAMNASNDLLLFLNGTFFNESNIPGSNFSYPGELYNYDSIEIFFMNSSNMYLQVILGPLGHYMIYMWKDWNLGSAARSYELNYTAKIVNGLWIAETIIPLAYFPFNVTTFNAYNGHGNGTNRTAETMFSANFNSGGYQKLTHSIDFNSILPQNSFDKQSNNLYWG